MQIKDFIKVVQNTAHYLNGVYADPSVTLRVRESALAQARLLQHSLDTLQVDDGAASDTQEVEDPSD